MNSSEPIAIVGSSCRFPGNSNKPSKLWDLLKSPRDLLSEVPIERYNSDAFHHSDPLHHGTTNVRKSYFISEDPACFDNAFFGIPSSEAEAIDPQQRILMETVYDCLCAAGQTIEGLRGSSTAVYVGLMCDDWSGVIASDLEVFPKYGATGMARSIMSNRISYFFDWHGPSMTIDTACSSSLVAVHEAVRCLRDGESKVAIAAGANLILTPGMYVAESKLSMLSSSGSSRMWDKDVDGYARGEGLAAVVLKPLSAAIQDNDHIECLIRATGVNQDGRTPGLTMPSATAQTELIRKTYARAGLDIEKAQDRPQLFHAHGTGTPAGDPQEAEAISRAFFSTGSCDDKLYVGSIKTIIGHTEGSAGLASLLGTSLALQHGMIPPNMHFNTLNPRIVPFYDHLEVPTNVIPWPELYPGQPRRASINSFGFGGTNAHAILEQYTPEPAVATNGPLLTPLTFSASSEGALRNMLAEHSQHFKSSLPDALHDIAYTLQTRRSTLPHRVAVPASTIEDACAQINAIVAGELESSIGVRQLAKDAPRILGVFTGQGSQWPQMGAKLLEASPFVTDRLSELDQSLADLPHGDRPGWTLRDMILVSRESSRVAEAEISQPVCTAVQILLVDMLRLAGIRLEAAVGHSSGEIGAAYAAGVITARVAILIAYYRGLYAKLARSPNGKDGSMMAVGTTFEDAAEFCGLKAFAGRIQVAARNSSSSITLSGDADAISEAIDVFKDEGKFSRQLKVDTAYHSSHVLPCAEPYLKAMEACGVESAAPTGVKWYSSVKEEFIVTSTSLTPQYWVDNMTNPVLFAPAVAHAWAKSGPYDLIIEIGPHPVLKTPCTDTVEEIAGYRPPYTGVLGRFKDDVKEFASALGYIWTQLGPGSVDFDCFERAISTSTGKRKLLSDLPTYPFDHSRRFMTLSRLSGLYNRLQDPTHPLLGKRCHDRETTHEMQWRNILHVKEIPWLNGHRIQGQLVFPATGYISMAVEAIHTIAKNETIGPMSIEDLSIGRAMTFLEDDTSFELLFNLKVVMRTESEIHAEFSCNSGSPKDHMSTLTPNANGTIKAKLSRPSPNILPRIELDDLNLSEVTAQRFYKFLGRLGYNYEWPFKGTTAIQRKANYAIGTIEDQSGTAWEDQLILHPGMLDTALQTTLAAFCCPGDERLWTLHVPTRFRSIVINPYFTTLEVGKQRSLRYVSVAQEYQMGNVTTELNLQTENGDTFLQIEGIGLVPVAAASQDNDAVLFSNFDYQAKEPDGELAAANYTFSQDDLQIAIDSERISLYYLRQLVENVTVTEKANTLPHYRHLLDWASHAVTHVQRGENPHVPRDAEFDTQADIELLLGKHYERTDVRLLRSVGENLPHTIRDHSNILEHMTKDGMLDNVYEDGFGLDLVNKYIAHMTGQIAHRYPRMNIVEIGAGTGGSTRRILPQLGSAFSTYTYTDISSAFFSTAQNRFSSYASRMLFKTFDMNKSPASQNFVEGSYDLVIASNVLHATLDLEKMMRHVRSLLRPGGYLIVLETVNNDSLRIGLPMGSLPGWWLGVETGRRWGPTLTLPQWHSLLRNCGFGGIDTTTPPVHRILPGHVFCGQALDERVRMLRSPLDTAVDLPATKASQLVIVGGETLTVHKLAERLSFILAPRYGKVVRVHCIEALNIEGLAEASTILSLTELDDPIFSIMTAAKLDALKVLFRQSGNILWVTSGARAENPYANMSLGMGRCMRYEYPNIAIQALDIDRVNERTTHLLAEHLVRLELLETWTKELRPGELLWSLEPEIFIENDASIIPRLYPYAAGNGRYNSSRRLLSEQVDPQKEKLLFREDGEKSSWKVQKPSPLRISPLPPLSSGTKEVRITHFSQSTVRVLPGCKLLLCTGVDLAAGGRVVAVSQTAESPAVIPAEWAIPIDTYDPVLILALASASMVSQDILRQVGRNETLLVHDPHPLIAFALHKLASSERIKLVFTTWRRDKIQHGWQLVDQFLPERVIKALLLSTTPGHFVNLSRDSEGFVAGRAIGRCLPHSCNVIEAERHFGISTECRPFVSPDKVAHQFTLAIARVRDWANTEDLIIDVPVVALQDLAAHARSNDLFRIVDCTAPSVAALVRPIDDGYIFQSNRSYFLVGLAGQLGQSLCTWMVAHGARYITLTSRRPKVQPAFMSRMEGLGATVQVLSMDITSRDSLLKCYQQMSTNMPPVGGVANGAMVLQDALFDNMPHEAFMDVLRPKVLGSQLLDELFYESDLEFFISFSSTTAVMGNSGQSNYIAGNMFMNALAAQRRKRGQVASSIDISSIIGIGYVERAEDLSEDTFVNMGYKPMSEQDLHQLFAEAIVIGQSPSSGISELVTGLTPIYSDAQAKDHYLKDVKFCHFLKERQGTLESKGGTLSAPVRVQLAEVKTRAEVTSIINQSFIARLRRVLAVPSDEIICEDVPLVEQGVDSLMAVEVRSWLLKELDVDIPVLKILGGSSVQDILMEALNLLPLSIVNLTTLEIGQGIQQSEAAPAHPVYRPTDLNEGSISSSDASGTEDSQLKASMSTTSSLDEAISNLKMSWQPTTASTVSTDGEHAVALNDRPWSGLLETSCPMSFGQAGFWFMNQYLSKKTVFNMAVMLKLSGPIHIDRLDKAVRTVANRHETFRTVFFWSGEELETPMQGIMPTSFMKLTTRKISSEQEAEAEMRNLHSAMWDLGTGDAVKISLLSLPDQKHFLLLGTHHIFLDGYSFSIYFKELEAAYMGASLPSMGPGAQFRDFANQQRHAHEENEFGDMIAFYRDVLPAEFKPIELLPFAKLPTRQSITYIQHEASVRIGPDLASRIRYLARRNRSTSFHVYTAALQALLFRFLPNAEHLVIGIADANRLDKEFMNSIGFFLNLLPLFFKRPDASTTIDSLVQGTRDAAYRALQYSRLPFDVLLRELKVPRSADHTPMFQVFMDYRQVVQDRSTWAECKLDGEEWFNSNTGYDVALEITENMNADTLLNLRVQDALYAQESSGLMLRSYVHVLECMVNSKDRLVDSLSVWCPDDIEAALAVGKGPSFVPEWQPTIAHRIEDIIKECGSRIALRDGNGVNLTYEEMGHRIDVMSKRLRMSQVTKGTIVGVFQEPSADWICSMLAIFKAGAVYVPLDLRNSLSRLRSIINMVRPAIILTDQTTTGHIQDLDANDVEMLIQNVSCSETPMPPQPNFAEPDDQAVILFTSGSTGEPKGLKMTHANIAAFAEVSSQTFARTDEKLVVLQQSPFSFDFSLDQIFAALANGGCLYVVPACLRGDPIEISKIMVAEKVTYTAATPSEYDMWLRYGSSLLPECASWTYAFSGGEAMSPTLALKFANLDLPALQLFNGYGPAETTILSTKMKLDFHQLKETASLPAGFMLPGFSVCIIDADQNPVPCGVTGEIVIGGPCVVAGYLNNAESTGKKFIPDVFFSTRSKVYRSGDRGRLLLDGTLFCDGRLEGDTQVKLRGFRVELMEVEKALVRHAAGSLSNAVVTLRGEGEGSYLAAHVVFTAGYPEAVREEFIRTMQQSLPLPSYMRPSAIVTLTDIPRTSHLKVDRRAIQEMPLPARHSPSFADELSTKEQKLSQLWREVMPFDPGPLARGSNFFVEGGNSILLVKLQARIKEVFLAAPKLDKLVGASTLGAMSSAIEISSSSKTIDWDSETQMPASFQAIATRESGGKLTELTILLTGSSGYLGHNVLARLIEDSNVVKVISLVRYVNQDLPHSDPNNKVTHLQGDLSQQQFGLSDQAFHEIAESIDVIIHCAANRSFWDKYEVLRPDNLDSVKELIRMAASRCIPLHFVSSGAVDVSSEEATLPPEDSSGYLLTKWAAEVFLHRAARALKIPVYIHRPIGLPDGACTEELSQHAVLSELMSIVDKLGIRPSFEGVNGSVDVVPVEQVVRSIHKSITPSVSITAHDESDKYVRIMRHEAVLRVFVKDFESYLSDKDNVRELQSLPLLQWFGRAKKAGFSFFIMAQELVMNSSDGTLLISRR